MRLRKFVSEADASLVLVLSASRCKIPWHRLTTSVAFFLSSYNWRSNVWRKCLKSKQDVSCPVYNYRYCFWAHDWNSSREKLKICYNVHIYYYPIILRHALRKNISVLHDNKRGPWVYYCTIHWPRTAASCRCWLRQTVVGPDWGKGWPRRPTSAAEWCCSPAVCSGSNSSPVPSPERPKPACSVNTKSSKVKTCAFSVNVSLFLDHNFFLFFSFSSENVFLHWYVCNQT